MKLRTLDNSIQIDLDMTLQQILDSVISGYAVVLPEYEAQQSIIVAAHISREQNELKTIVLIDVLGNVDGATSRRLYLESY